MRKQTIINNDFNLMSLKGVTEGDPLSLASLKDSDGNNALTYPFFEYLQDENLLVDAIREYKKQKLNYKLPVMLGLNYEGQYEFADLTKLKHIVLAGQTGSGKSMFEHTLIMTLLNLMPIDIKFLLSDVKRVELTPYTGIPQLIGKVIVEPEVFFTQLEELIEEKEKRLHLKDGIYPYIVAIFDTISDITYTDPKRFNNLMEKLLVNCHQAKIYVIVCDSRTHGKVFTETVMSLMPTKICFATSDTDGSQCIIRSDLAHHLYGRGDALLLRQGEIQPMRLQTPWIDDREIEKLVNKLKI